MWARKRISIIIKDFYACDDFFRTIVQAHIIALFLYYQDFTKINDLQTWLSKNNCPDIIAQIEKQYLDSENVQNLCDRAKINGFVDIATKLNT